MRFKYKHSLASRWAHWINFPLLAVMVWSGTLIYWANAVYRVGVGQHTLFKMTFSTATASSKAGSVQARLVKNRSLRPPLW